MPSSQMTTNYDLGYNGYKANFKMIENYIYLHHVDKFIVLPSFIDSVQDSQPIEWSVEKPLSRSAPIYSYKNSGPRTVQVTFNLHRDLMQDINRNVSNIGNIKGVEIDYIDTFIKYIQASVLPDYQATSKVVNPPIVSLKLGNDIFIKGVISNNLGITYKYPILSNGRFAEVVINITISEIDPYSARDVLYTGSYRSVSISTNLDRKDYNLYGSPNPSTNLDTGRAITNNQGFGGRAGGGSGRKGIDDAPIGSGNTGNQNTTKKTMFNENRLLADGSKEISLYELDRILNQTVELNEGEYFKNGQIYNPSNYDKDLKEKNPNVFAETGEKIATTFRTTPQFVANTGKELAEDVVTGWRAMLDYNNTSQNNIPNKYYSYDNNLKEKNSMYFNDAPDRYYNGNIDSQYSGDAPDTYYNN